MKYLALLLFLASCANNNGSSSTQSAMPNLELLFANRDTCLKIQSNPSNEYYVRVSKDAFYYIINKQVSLWDTKTITSLATTIVDFNSFCTLDVVAGELKSVNVPTITSCGGQFQPACQPAPIQQPQPHVCGPNGQLCFY